MRESMKRLTATVRGRVQGVSFRYYVRERARQLNLSGWVRNERDGSVTVVAEGPEDQLNKLLSFVHRGPTGARVDDVDIWWSEAAERSQGFEIRWA